MNRREFGVTGAAAVAALTGGGFAHGVEPTAKSAEGRVLYNGIRLPADWPPRVTNGALHLPSTPLYLLNPPQQIPIDVGRQLFVDDFLIEHSTLRRVFHQPVYHPGGPVLRPDQAWEQQGKFPCAAVYSDGVWYDPQDQLFKLWYMASYRARTCYAVSQDGIVWEKPQLALQAGTNIVSTADRDSAVVWLDHEEKDPGKRFKLFRAHREEVNGRGNWYFQIHVSRDGIQWGEVVGRSAGIYPRSTVFRNPFLKQWQYSIRKDSSTQVGRCRRLFECDDAIRDAGWETAQMLWWLGADTLDMAREETQFRPQLTNFDAVAYESVMLGLFTLWRGKLSSEPNRPELNDVCLGFSRDGFYYARPDRRPFLPMSETAGDWNWGNVQSAGGGCLVVGDKLYFYCSGRSGTAENSEAGGSTGLAILRRDGFASLDAGDVPGTITTRPVTFTGRHLFVNAAAPQGNLRVEVLDERGAAIAPFTLSDCVSTATDTTRGIVAWRSTDDLSPLVGRAVRFRFTLKNARLFAFWVSPDKHGSSRGYVAAGGPGVTQPAS